MKEQKELVCISCPLGCHLTVSYTPGDTSPEDVSVEGNRCPRGEEYGKEELLAPKRVVTATAAIEASSLKRLPVVTDAALPRELIDELLTEVYAMRLKAPLSRGSVIIKNFRDTGVNLVASRTAPL